MATTMISLKWQDAEGRSRTERLWFDAATMANPTQAQDALDDIEALIDILSGCQLAEANVTFPLTLAGVGSVAEGYNVRSGATLSFIDENMVGQNLYIPGVLDSLMQAGAVQNTGNMAAFITAMISGGFGTGTYLPVTRNTSAAWDTFVKGVETTRKT